MATQLLAKFESTPSYTFRNSQVRNRQFQHLNKSKSMEAFSPYTCSLSGFPFFVLMLQVFSCLSFPVFLFSDCSISSAFLINGLPNLSAKRSSSPNLDVTGNVHTKVRPLVQPKPPPEIQVDQNSLSYKLVSDTTYEIAVNAKSGFFHVYADISSTYKCNRAQHL